MGTCGEDYSTTTKVGYMLLGAATSVSTTPTTDQACNAIQLAQDFIDGYLHKATSYTSGSVPKPITWIATRIATNICQVQRWWANTEGAMSDSDAMGASQYPDDLFERVMTESIRKDLDEWQRQEDYYLSGRVGLVIATPQNADLDFSKDNYP